MALYDDPKIVKKVTALAKRGLTRKDIAEEAGVSTSTVRKILDPGYAESERDRLRLADEARAPRWDDAGYRAYQTAYGATPERLKQVREGMQRLRRGRNK